MLSSSIGISNKAFWKAAKCYCPQLKYQTRPSEKLQNVNVVNWHIKQALLKSCKMSMSSIEITTLSLIGNAQLSTRTNFDIGTPAERYNLSEKLQNVIVFNWTIKQQGPLKSWTMLLLTYLPELKYQHVHSWYVAWEGDTYHICIMIGWCDGCCCCYHLLLLD